MLPIQVGKTDASRLCTQCRSMIALELDLEKRDAAHIRSDQKVIG